MNFISRQEYCIHPLAPNSSTHLVVPDLTDRTPIGWSGTPDLNWPDHDEADLLPTPPLRNLAGSARSPLPDQPRLLKTSHHSRPGWNAKWEKIPRKYSIREPEASHIRRFMNLVRICLFRFRRSKRSRPMQITPPPPIIVLAAVWRADSPSPIILPDRRADRGKQMTPWSGDNWEHALSLQPELIKQHRAKCSHQPALAKSNKFLAEKAGMLLPAHPPTIKRSSMCCCCPPRKEDKKTNKANQLNLPRQETQKAGKSCLPFLHPSIVKMNLNSLRRCGARCLGRKRKQHHKTRFYRAATEDPQSP